jgi:hypothetical protein
MLLPAIAGKELFIVTYYLFIQPKHPTVLAAHTPG